MSAERVTRGSHRRGSDDPDRAPDRAAPPHHQSARSPSAWRRWSAGSSTRGSSTSCSRRTATSPVAASPAATSSPTSPLEGFAVRHEDHRLRRDRARDAGDPLADLALRVAGPLQARAALRVAVRPVGLALFVMGARLAYWTLPKALDWLSTIGGNNITQAYTADKYYQLIAYMMLAFGICFEFPILLVFLQMAGIVTQRVAAEVPPPRHRRHLRRRRGRDAEQRPDQPVRAVGPAVSCSTRSRSSSGGSEPAQAPRRRCRCRG